MNHPNEDGSGKREKKLPRASKRTNGPPLNSKLKSPKEGKGRKTKGLLKKRDALGWNS